MSYAGRKTIGVYIDRPETFFFHKEFLRSLHEESAKHDTNLIAFVIDSSLFSYQSEKERFLFYECMVKGILDGVILVTPTLPPYGEKNSKLLALLESRPDLPVVSAYDVIPGHPSFIVDNSRDFSLLLDHLFGHHGYRSPVYVSGPHNTYDSLERLKMFRQALDRFSLPYDESDVFTTTFHFNDGAQAVEEFFDRRSKNPDVVICGNDSTAFGVRYALLKRGILVPDDIAVTGFDDIRISDWNDISLTTIRNPVREIAVRSFLTLMNMLNGETGIPRQTTLETRFVIRESCGCVFDNSQRTVSERVNSLTINEGLIRRLNSLGETDKLKVENFILQGETLHHHALLENMRQLNEIADKLVHEMIGNRSPDTRSPLYKLLMEKLGITNFILSQFSDPDDPMNSGITMKVAYVNGLRVDLPKKGISLQTAELIPRDLMAERRFSLVTEALYTEKNHYGIILIDWGAEGDNIYELLRRRFSVAMESIRISQHQEALNEELTLAKKKQEVISMTDELTGLYNRRGFLILGNQMCQFCRRQKYDFMILYMDLDGLKKINDVYGHDEGDAALKVFSDVLKESLRETDIIARFGGDEFTALAANINSETEEELLTRLRMNAGKADKKLNKSWSLSFSMGVFYSETGSQLSLEQMLSRADEELYKVKQDKKKI